MCRIFYLVCLIDYYQKKNVGDYFACFSDTQWTLAEHRPDAVSPPTRIKSPFAQYIYSAERDSNFSDEETHNDDDTLIYIVCGILIQSSVCIFINYYAHTQLRASMSVDQLTHTHGVFYTLCIRSSTFWRDTGAKVDSEGGGGRREGGQCLRT